LIAVSYAGFDITNLAIVAGALSVGIGFGLQSIVNNFVSGLILLVERPIKVGDRIEIGTVTGSVAEIRARATLVRTNDDIYLIVPNSRFVTETVTNWSYRSPRVRFHFPVSVASASDPRAVEQALLEAAAKNDHVLKEPAPTVRFAAFGESSLDFELACWTAVMLHRRNALRSEMNYAIHAANSRVQVWTMPTNEEIVVARQAVALLGGK